MSVMNITDLNIKGCGITQETSSPLIVNKQQQHNETVYFNCHINGNKSDNLRPITKRRI